MGFSILFLRERFTSFGFSQCCSNGGCKRVCCVGNKHNRRRSFSLWWTLITDNSLNTSESRPTSWPVRQPLWDVPIHPPGSSTATTPKRRTWNSHSCACCPTKTIPTVKSPVTVPVITRCYLPVTVGQIPIVLTLCVREKQRQVKPSSF